MALTLAAMAACDKAATRAFSAVCNERRAAAQHACVPLTWRALSLHSPVPYIKWLPEAVPCQGLRRRLHTGLCSKHGTKKALRDARLRPVLAARRSNRLQRVVERRQPPTAARRAHAGEMRKPGWIRPGRYGRRRHVSRHLRATATSSDIESVSAAKVLVLPEQIRRYCRVCMPATANLWA